MRFITTTTKVPWISEPSARPLRGFRGARRCDNAKRCRTAALRRSRLWTTNSNVSTGFQSWATTNDRRSCSVPFMTSDSGGLLASKRQRPFRGLRFVSHLHVVVFTARFVFSSPDRLTSSWRGYTHTNYLDNMKPRSRWPNG